MISLNIYSENIKNSTVGSIRDNLVADLPDKETIVEHLKNGQVIAAYCGIARDIFTGEVIPGEWVLQSDGKYKWSSAITYYVSQYNLKLPDDFIKHVLQK